MCLAKALSCPPSVNEQNNKYHVNSCMTANVMIRAEIANTQGFQNWDSKIGT